MAEYNPSKIIKDGNTYNFRDTTKISLSGSNAISGDLIPATDNSIDIGSSTNNIKMLYAKGITIDAKTVDTVEEQGEGYIRYSSGIQICWGLGEYDDGAVISYPKVFRGLPSIVTSSTANGTNWGETSFAMGVYSGRTYACWQAIGRWK